MMSRNTVLYISLIFVALGISACNKKHSGSNINDGVLLLNTTGGDDAIGQWTVLDNVLSVVDTLAQSSGTPTLNASSVSDTSEETGTRAGFQFNRVDGYFYGLLPSTDRPGVDPPSRSTDLSASDVIRFHPGTDTIEHLATIPYLYAPGATEPYGDYLTAPAISSDGKSLLLVARAGGQAIPPPPNHTGGPITIGGVVHLNIDPASADYRKFTPVYDFHDYGVGKPWDEQLDSVETQPLLVETPSGPVLFLVTNAGVWGNPASPDINSSEAVALTPGDLNDWSQPWSMLGDRGGALGQPAKNVWYDTFHNEFWWASELVVTSPVEDTKVFKRSGPDGSVEFNTTFIPKLYGAKSPQAMFSYPGLGNFLFTAGMGPGCNPDPFVCQGKIIEVILNNTPVTRAIFNSYWTGNPRRLLAAGLASSINTGFHFLNAVSDTSVADFERFIDQGKFTLTTTTDPYLSKTLDELYADAGILPARLDRYDFGNFALGNLFQGTAADGYMLIGSPAIGGLVSEPINDRYVVSLAIHGGANGAGAIIKHDRLTNTTTSIPLGSAMPSAPIGKAIQLADGSLLGGAYRRARAGLFPQRPAPGVWVQSADPATPMVDYELPALVMQVNTTDFFMEATDAPYAFVQAADGSIWATARYRVTSPGWTLSCTFNMPPRVCTPFVMALVAFDPQTGQPTGEVHVLADSVSLNFGFFTEASANGNVLTYVTPALLEDGIERGERLWLVDLADRDSNNTPASNAVVLSPTGGAAGTAWVTPFAPALQTSSGHFFFMTEATDAGSEVQIHRMELGATVADIPTITTVVTSQTKIPGTPLFEASDGMFYYGTRDGVLMRFNPGDDSVNQVADLVASGMTSDVRGFLSEIRPGVLAGIVVDSSVSQSELASRAFMYDTATQITTTMDVSDLVSVQDEFPGLLPITYNSP